METDLLTGVVILIGSKGFGISTDGRRRMTTMNELWPRDENQGRTSTLIDEVIRLALDEVPEVVVYCHDNRWCHNLGDLVIQTAQARCVYGARESQRSVVVHDTDVMFLRAGTPGGPWCVTLYDNSCELAYKSKPNWAERI
jgi:hypothetical protein